MRGFLEQFVNSRGTVLGVGILCASLAATASGSPPTDPTEKAESARDTKTGDLPPVDVLTALRAGDISVRAEGTGDGRMTLSITNKTKRDLRVVLPPGLIASGASGQFGGMGGMGGGMGGMGGGMGGMGGGMGGMGGGMGGMGGGMGGMGGGMGGMGGGMRGGMGGGTLPPSMGMMMLGRLIMNLIGDRDSWDTRSLMSGMGGMGGMGGGMGGMGGMGGGMGGMGGGFRSVPPTSLPSASLRPGQTRHLPTRLFSLTLPANPTASFMPRKGESLRIGDISQLDQSERVRRTINRLAADKAPENVATLVMWSVSGGVSWNSIEQAARPWANEHELSLAKSLVSRIDQISEGETGEIDFDVQGTGNSCQALTRTLAALLKNTTVLGLRARGSVPSQPDAPALACRLVVSDDSPPSAVVHVGTTDASGTRWLEAGRFTLPIPLKDGQPDGPRLVDALAQGMLDRLVRAQVSRAGLVKGKPVYKIRIDNASPLVLNGLAITGAGGSRGEGSPKVLSAISVPPHRSLTLPATLEVVEELGLRKGVRVIAADLSGL